MNQSASGYSFGISLWTVVGDAESVPLDAHLQRAAAVHESLQSYHHLEAHWGSLDAAEPRRLVELVVDIDHLFAGAVSAAPLPLRAALIGQRTKPDLATAIAAIVDRLRTEQKRGRLGRFDFYLGDGNRVRCEPDAEPTVLGFRSPDTRKEGRTA